MRGVVDECVDARQKAGGECELRRYPVHTFPGEHPLQHVVEVLVRARHDAAEEVGVSGRDVHLEYLRDRRQMRDHVVAGALRDLERGEREDAVAERVEIEVGPGLTDAARRIAAPDYPWTWAGITAPR